MQILRWEALKDYAVVENILHSVSKVGQTRWVKPQSVSRAIRIRGTKWQYSSFVMLQIWLDQDGIKVAVLKGKVLIKIAKTDQTP